MSSQPQPFSATSSFTDQLARRWSFIDMNSIVGNSYYGMLRGEISLYLAPEHQFNSKEQKKKKSRLELKLKIMQISVHFLI